MGNYGQKNIAVVSNYKEFENARRAINAESLRRALFQRILSCFGQDFCYFVHNKHIYCQKHYGDLLTEKTRC